MVTLATPLPICLKYEHSSKGGCTVKCKDVCVELPLGNTKGPVYTNGEACSISSGNPEGSGPGSGDGDGGPDAPGSGNSGSTAFPGWYNFEPVIGDATGTSVSGAVAKLNKNLGSALGMLAGNADLTYFAVNEIRGLSQRVVNAGEAAQQLLKEISEYNRVANAKLEGAELVAARSENYLEQIAKNTSGGGAGDGEGGTEGGDTETGDDFDQQSLFRMLEAINDNISHTGGDTARNSGDLLQAFYSLQQQLASGDAGGSQQGGGEGTGGADIDYSKMPGSESAPLSVRSASYDSKGCEGGANCFFDLPTMQGKLDEANNALTGSYKAISEDMKRIFSFNFYGSAEPMKCLDLFSLYGKDYSVCPPSADFWSTLAALMMFIFYFVALMVIFKR
jgi:hypothetical protein